jgi:hypothetical protein
MKKSIISIFFACLLFAACSEPKTAQTDQHGYVCRMPVQAQYGTITALSGVVYIYTPQNDMTTLYEIGKGSDTLADYAGYNIQFTAKGTTLLGVQFAKNQKQTSYVR